ECESKQDRAQSLNHLTGKCHSVQAFRGCDSVCCFCERSRSRDAGGDEADRESIDNQPEKEEPGQSRVDSLRSFRSRGLDFHFHRLRPPHGAPIGARTAGRSAYFCSPDRIQGPYREAWGALSSTSPSSFFHHFACTVVPCPAVSGLPGMRRTRPFFTRLI